MPALSFVVRPRHLASGLYHANLSKRAVNGGVVAGAVIASLSFGALLCLGCWWAYTRRLRQPDQQQQIDMNAGADGAFGFETHPSGKSTPDPTPAPGVAPAASDESSPPTASRSALATVLGKLTRPGSPPDDDMGIQPKRVTREKKGARKSVLRRATEEGSDSGHGAYGKSHTRGIPVPDLPPLPSAIAASRVEAWNAQVQHQTRTSSTTAHVFAGPTAPRIDAPRSSSRPSTPVLVAPKASSRSPGSTLGTLVSKALPSRPQAAQHDSRRVSIDEFPGGGTPSPAPSRSYFAEPSSISLIDDERERTPSPALSSRPPSPSPAEAEPPQPTYLDTQNTRSRSASRDGPPRPLPPIPLDMDRR